MTAMMHVDQNLQESENYRFKEALKRSKIVVFEQDEQLKYIQVFNPHPGFKGKSALGKTDEELLPPEDARHLTLIKRTVFETGKPVSETVRTTIDGTAFYYRLTVDPVKDASGKIQGIVCTAIDISEHIQTELALRNSERRLQLALDGGQMGMWEWDIANNQSVWSSKIFELMNLPEMEGPFSTEIFFRKLYRDDQPRIRESLNKVLESGTEWRDENPYREKVSMACCNWSRHP
jgi:PAS domain S-box-containing protein